MTAVSSVSSCMHWIRGCIIILLLTILDQGSKSLVLAQLKDQPDISLKTTGKTVSTATKRSIFTQ